MAKLAFFMNTFPKYNAYQTWHSTNHRGFEHSPGTQTCSGSFCPHLLYTEKKQNI